MSRISALRFSVLAALLLSSATSGQTRIPLQPVADVRFTDDVLPYSGTRANPGSGFSVEPDNPGPDRSVRASLSFDDLEPMQISISQGQECTLFWKCGNPSKQETRSKPMRRVKDDLWQAQVEWKPSRDDSSVFNIDIRYNSRTRFVVYRVVHYFKGVLGTGANKRDVVVVPWATSRDCAEPALLTTFVDQNRDGIFGNDERSRWAQPFRAGTKAWTATEIDPKGAWISFSARDDAPAFARSFHFPDTELTALDGAPLKTSSLKGNWVMVNVWATGCAPCVVEIPSLSELADEFRPLGVKFIAISPESASTLRHFLSKHPFSYAQFRIEDSDHEIFAYGFPQHVLINPEGIIETIIPGGGSDSGNVLKQTLLKSSAVPFKE